MSESNTRTKVDAIDLKQQLVGLSAAQRARLIRRLGEGKSAAAIPKARPLRVEENPQVAVYPASPGQQRMWFLHHYALDSPVYNVPSAFHLAGPLNVAWLEAAFHKVIQRHDILRTTFATEKGELFQRVAAASGFQLQSVNLEEIPADKRKPAVEQSLTAQACRPFDLAAEPPFRAVLVKLQPDEYVLLLVMHHIISDGWSRSNFYRELSAAYAALAAGQPAPVRELPVQFADYSAWQKEWLASGALETQTAYWKTKLAGEPEPLELPSDRSRPATESFRGENCARQLDSDLMAALKTRAQEEGATLFMILLAAFKTLLHRYTRHHDLSVGVPIANRQRAEVEELIGFFVNTLVMRTTFSGDPTFRELLRRVKTTAVEAYANQDVPLERLVEMLQVRRDASRTPLFQATFALMDYPAVVFQLPGIQAAPWFVTTHTSKFDLSLTLEHSAEGWMAVAEYSADLFDADRVERMLDHWRVILESVSSSPAQRVSEIPLLTAAERQQILVGWNQTPREYPRDKCVHQLFEEQVKHTPDAVAVVFEGSSLTYWELNARANQLAQHLRSRGVGPDVLVAICMERSLEMVVGLLGILKAGGAYVPIDPTYPADRVAFMLGNANTSVILIQKALREKLPSTSATVICLDSGWEVIKQESEFPPTTGVTAENLAYVIYTSGSTGRPKGAMNTHRGICNRLLWMQETYQLTESDRVLQKTPFSFDISVWEFFWPLLSGARLVIALPGGHRDSKYLVRTIISQQITTLHFVPSMLRHFLQEADIGGLSTLRQIFCGGEALTWDVHEAFFKRLPDVPLYNLYGPTEAAVDVTHWTCQPSSSLGIVPIGRPIANIQIYILDEARQPVPVGVAGELHIGGVGVARGYLNQPELTAERFIPHPFSDKPDARLYRTGDLARYLRDGNIEFLGRMDQQVKIHGIRIELGEIESVLCTHPALSACAVFAKPDGSNGMRLNAVVVARDASALSVVLLRQWLGQKLPDFMIPSRFVAVPELPLGPNGKLDRKALDRLDGFELASGTEYVTPRNETEREITAIWQAVLHRERIGVHDSFFNLGGNSLLAVVICSRIHKQFNLEVPLRRLFEHPTIAKLSATLLGAANLQDKALPVTDGAQSGRVHPLSPAQFQLWFLDQLEPGSALYILPLLLRLRGTLNLPALNRSLTELVRRHESLRTIFLIENHQPLACVLPAREVPLEVIAIDAAGPDRDREGHRRAEDFARQPFDLAKGPVFRAGLVSLTPDDHILALAMHHIVSDGWSLEVIQRDLAQCYGCLLNGLVPGWAPLPMSFADYVDWQQQQLANGEQARQLAYWKQQLAGVPSRLNLPADHPRPSRQEHLGATQLGVLDQSLTQDLKRLASDNDATLFMVILSAFEVLLQRLSGQDDFVIGVPASGRLLVETQEMVGFFMTSLPLRANLAGGSSFVEVLKRCRETFLQATENQGVPMHYILTELQTERDLSQTPLFQVFINHLSYERKACIFESLETELITPAVVDAKFDLTLYFEEVDGQLKLGWVYDCALFIAERMREMICQFELLLRQVASDPERCMESYSLTAPNAHTWMPAHQVISPVAWTGNVAERFRKQAERTPEAEAVVLGEDTLTYGELHTRSSQLAHNLQNLGVGPEVMVGIYLERSLETVVALLAVLKAGGAVVPIDPDLPKARIEFIMADTQMPWLITQSSLLGNLPASGARILCLDQVLPSPTAGAPSVISDPSVRPENLAYIIYTSGSTGRPKGVLISQAAYLNYCGPAIDYWQLKSSDRVLQFARFGFDINIDQLLTPLLAGATVVMRAGEIWDPAVFTEVIKEKRLTMVHLPSFYWKQWVETFSQDDVGKAIGTLRLIQVGGDVMPVDAVRRWREFQVPAVRLINRYGPTEATMFTTAYEVPAEEPVGNNPSRIPIGRPVDPRTIHILDRQRNPVPAGATGEIYIGGEAVARGYLNRPELTAEHFIPDPFSDRQGARLYKTGDLGCLLPDGNIDFLGRADFQVKIRGYRIELGEIEAVLGGHPELSSCAIVTQELKDGDKALVAFVCSRMTEGISNELLRQWLLEILPDYMVPSRFVLLKTLPLTPNGKVDRKALQKLDVSELSSGINHMAPRTELERDLAQIWQAVLRRQRVGMHDSFFELGGHSLLAVAICSQIKERLDIKVPLRWIFEHPTIECLAIQMETLFANAEQPQTLQEWNQTRRDYPHDRCIHQLFEEQVKLNPEAVAVEFEAQTLTYRELNARANRLAHQLRKLGVGPDAPVALCVERSLEMAVGVLGILKAGGAYVPLDPTYPPERLAYMIRDTVASVLVTQAALANRFSDSHAEILFLETLPPDLAEDNPNIPISTNSLAYILYTSGSTGQPKGVAMEHAPLVNLMQWQESQTKYKQPLRTLQFAPLGFDVSFQEMFSTWFSGGTLVLVDPQTRLNPPALWRFVAQRKLERLFLPVITLQHLAEAAAHSAQAAPELREIITAGEQLRITPAIRDFFAAQPQRTLHNQYGPTESHVVTAWTLPTDPAHWPDLPPIGRPIANTTIYLLDAQMNPVPLGSPGEIYIGGAALARGYWRQPERTTGHFVPDPFAPRPNARLYRTGDLARCRPAGNFEYLGRLDQQVKIRGYRIELGEIEAVLQTHSSVSACAVAVQENPTGEKSLAAFLIPRAGAELSAGSLRAWLVEKLPDYMIPSRFVSVPVLPLNSNGKLDRQALEKLVGHELASGTDYVAPRNKRERELAEIWQAVLEREPVGVWDNFFALGGHSLKAFLVCSQINRRLGLEVPLRWIFEHPTIEAQAILLLEKEVAAREAVEMERLLAEVEAIEESAAADFLFKSENENKVSNGNTALASRSMFHCPDSPSVWFGRRRCNLIILINEDFEMEVFERLAGMVREFDPLINVVVLRDQAGTQPGLPPGPTLTFSPAFVRHPQAARGKIFCGYPLGKSGEYAALEKAGFRVPKWALLCEGSALDLNGFGKYVVQKPDYGGRGAEVKVVRKERVRWKPITTRAAGTSSTMIIQEFIYTGPQPVSYRVNTLFGKVVYSVRHESSGTSQRQQSSKVENSTLDWGSIVASARGSRVSLNFDDEIIRLGEEAAQAFPYIPLLGFDIIREVPSGKLYVLEANAIGYVWNFDSRQAAEYGFSFEKQFDGLRKAAYLLAEKTQQMAV